MDETIIGIIKSMLAPAIMISACGLLLLGINNKYSLVVNRIRTLNSEFRELGMDKKDRRECILTQLPLLIERMKIIRNAVWLYTVSIAMFLFSIFSIGVYFWCGKTMLSIVVSLLLLIVALLTVLFGVLYAAKEVRLGYKILRIETKNIKLTKD